MKQQNIDNKVQQAFNTMNDSDLSIAHDKKEAVWQKLAINQSKPENKKTKSRWWVWFLLGTLFAVTSLGLKKLITETKVKTEKEKVEKILMADAQIPLEALQIELRSSKALQSHSKQKLDSILLINKKLKDEILTLSLKSSIASKNVITTNYVTDTVYISQIETKELIVENIIRDTIYIEVPIQSEEREILATLNNNEDNPEKDQTNHESNKKPASIQFNFSEADLD